MNDDWKITATITNPERRTKLESFFPGGVVPVKSMIPSLARLPDNGVSNVYFIDLAKISAEQRQGLVKHIAATFSHDPAFVEENLDKEGVPVLADDCVLTCADQGLFFSMLPDFDFVESDDWANDYDEEWGDDYP